MYKELLCHDLNWHQQFLSQPQKSVNIGYGIMNLCNLSTNYPEECSTVSILYYDVPECVTYFCYGVTVVYLPDCSADVTLFHMKQTVTTAGMIQHLIMSLSQ